MVDADVNDAITTALTVKDTNAIPSVMVAQNSNVLTLTPDNTGVVPGQTISCSVPGISSGTTVQSTFSNTVGGTATYYAVMSSPATAAITSPAACSLDLLSGLAVRSWG